MANSTEVKRKSSKTRARTRIKTNKAINQTKDFSPSPKTNEPTPGITDIHRTGYLSQTTHSNKPVGYQQSLRLSLAPLKLTPVSTMVKSPQFGAQKATGSSYWTHDQ